MKKNNISIFMVLISLFMAIVVGFVADSSADLRFLGGLGWLNVTLAWLVNRTCDDALVSAIAAMESLEQLLKEVLEKGGGDPRWPKG